MNCWFTSAFALWLRSRWGPWAFRGDTGQETRTKSSVAGLQCLLTTLDRLTQWTHQGGHYQQHIPCPAAKKIPRVSCPVWSKNPQGPLVVLRGRGRILEWVLHTTGGSVSEHSHMLTHTDQALYQHSLGNSPEFWADLTAHNPTAYNRNVCSSHYPESEPVQVQNSAGWLPQNSPHFQR